MSDMRTKHLPFKQEDGGVIDIAVDEFIDALSNRDLSVNNSRIFLPNMEKITGPGINRILVNKENEKSGLHVYRIKAPGFFYYQHYKGLWDPSGSIQILVCRSRDFNSTPVFELMNSKDTTGSGGNDHVNNMFPIRPGSRTYIIVRGSLAGKSSTKQLFFIPSWGVDSASDAISRESDVSLTRAVVSGTPNDVEFKACFE